VSRLSDVAIPPSGGELPPLPVVDWRRVSQLAPMSLPVGYTGPDAPLPRADVVVLTWTIAEWSALDQVFVTSSSTRPRNAWDWQRSWHQYSRECPTPSESAQSPLWAFYQLVEVPRSSGASIKAMLLKCDAHLAHPPWFAGLAEMVGLILDDVQPQMIYSIGTAGAARPETRLGDVVVTNAAHIKLTAAANYGAPVNDATFTSSQGLPSIALADSVATQLMFPMNTAVSFPALQTSLLQLHQLLPTSVDVNLEDLLTPALDPTNLAGSKPVPMPGIPLLTTDTYYIADGSGAPQWSALEMDDAVIGYVAGERKVEYAFVRNISDPVVPSVTGTGAQIVDEVRHQWASVIYEQFGLYTSFNGALTTWALIAGP
jgi:hypothetical protein